MTLAEFLLARIAEDAAVSRIGRRPSPRDLADCEAKRRIVERCARTASLTQPDRTGYLSDYVLAQLALSYADHRDYREEWKP